jgi:hypothetical protein
MTTTRLTPPSTPQLTWAAVPARAHSSASCREREQRALGGQQAARLAHDPVRQRQALQHILQCVKKGGMRCSFTMDSTGLEQSIRLYIISIHIHIYIYICIYIYKNIYTYTDTDIYIYMYILDYNRLGWNRVSAWCGRQADAAQPGNSPCARHARTCVSRASA